MTSNFSLFFRYFASFLLSGKIFHDLRKFKKHLLSSAQAIIKNYNTIPRAEALLKILMGNEIMKKSDLTALWEADKQCKLFFNDFLNM